MAEKIPVTVDLDALTLGDLEVLEAARDPKSASVVKLLDVLDRVVVGGARHLPFRSLQTIVDAINEATKDVANPT